MPEAQQSQLPWDKAKVYFIFFLFFFQVFLRDTIFLWELFFFFYDFFWAFEMRIGNDGLWCIRHNSNCKMCSLFPFLVKKKRFSSFRIRASFTVWHNLNKELVRKKQILLLQLGGAFVHVNKNKFFNTYSYISLNWLYSIAYVGIFHVKLPSNSFFPFPLVSYVERKI